jgi:bifunctional UDP-N-acetylglucosamine pyrophosphorylase/glucosamine-1-phosphate N-acetyltransferase
VKIGEAAYVGSGSVITENVPAGALALGRGRQVNKPDFAARRAGKSPAAKKPATALPNKVAKKKAKTKR